MEEDIIWFSKDEPMARIYRDNRGTYRMVLNTPARDLVIRDATHMIYLRFGYDVENNVIVIKPAKKAKNMLKINPRSSSTTLSIGMFAKQLIRDCGVNVENWIGRHKFYEEDGVFYCSVNESLQDIVLKSSDKVVGIGESISSTILYNAMLPKNFRKERVPLDTDFAVIENVTGVRCIAIFTNNTWMFLDKNGKRLDETFDMGDLDKSYIYDGVIATKLQSDFCQAVANNVFEKPVIKDISTDKAHVYNIFDIENDKPFNKRNKMLWAMSDAIKSSSNVRFLPVLRWIESFTTYDRMCLDDLLEKLAPCTEDGLLLYVSDAYYEHGRSKHMLYYSLEKSTEAKKS